MDREALHRVRHRAASLTDQRQTGPALVASVPGMRCDDALRQLLTHLAAVDDTDAGQQAADEADEILALITADREASGAIMLAMGSLLVYSLVEDSDKVPPERAIETLTTIGDPIDHLQEFLHAFLVAYAGGANVNQQAILLAAQITLSRDDTAIVLWMLATYLVFGCRRGPDTPEQFIGEFVASCIRQDLIPSRPLQPEQ